jgi:predicted MFS family arabinose efflux permease
MSRNTTPPIIRPASSWAGVYAIALGAFALVVTEFLPVGLLAGISRDLNVSEGTAGLAVTATALLGFVSAPLTALSIGCIDRRKVLLALTALLVVSSVMSSLASGFTMLLIARVILGIGIGGFWAISITAAARLVPADQVHRASSLVFAGISIGSVVSVPAGAYIAAHFDWRLAFMGASVLAVAVFLAQLVVLPRIEIAAGVSVRHFFGLLRSGKVRAILLTVIFIVSGQYAGYTFVTPYLEQVTSAGPAMVSSLMFGYGVVTVAGNFVGGALAGRNLHKTVIATVWIFLASLFFMAFQGDVLAIAVVSLAVWALSWGMAPVGTQLWLFAATQDAPEAAQAMNTSVFQLSIGLGSLLGGVAVNHVSLRSSMWLGAAILCLAVVMAHGVGRINRRESTTRGIPSRA